MEIWMENKEKIEEHNIRYNQVWWILDTTSEYHCT